MLTVQSGLTAAVLASDVTASAADDALVEYIRSYVRAPRTAMLGGNSVHVDRAFLLHEFPRTVEHLHYRIIDVSTVKELARRWHPQLVDHLPAKRMTHRALDDIRESIDEVGSVQGVVLTGSFGTTVRIGCVKSIDSMCDVAVRLQGAECCIWLCRISGTMSHLLCRNCAEVDSRLYSLFAYHLLTGFSPVSPPSLFPELACLSSSLNKVLIHQPDYSP